MGQNKGALTTTSHSCSPVQYHTNGFFFGTSGSPPPWRMGGRVQH